MRLKLEPVTADNWKETVFLTTDPDRKLLLDERWTAGNAFSLLQCHFEPDWDCRILVDGEKAVGFAFYGYWRERDHYLLCRYMIDVEFQNRGYGARFLPMVVDQIRSQFGCGDVYVTLDEENTRAKRLYLRAGFVPTGEKDEGERVYVLRG